MNAYDETTAAEITGVQDPESVHKLREETQGSPLLLHIVADQVRSGSDLQQVDLRVHARHIFDSQVARWRREGTDESRDPLYNALLLLAITEPVAPLTLDSLQGFLQHIDLTLSQNELHEELRMVASQLDGLASARIKLRTRKLAEHVCFDRLGRRDRCSLLERVVAWLAKDDLVEDELCMGFLRTWTDPGIEREEVVRKTVGSLITMLSDAGNKNRLYAIFDCWPKTESEMLPSAAVQCLRAAAELGHSDAMRRLGLRLLDGTGLPVDFMEGEKWLRKAAESGQPQAMRQLGTRLFIGDELPKNPTEGESWLRKAAEHQDTLAMGILGDWLLDGDGPPKNPTEGESWLRKAAELGDTWAMAILGNRLLEGNGLPKNPAEGESWLRKAVELGDTRAMAILGNRLLEGDGLPKNPAEGESWLRKAVELGDTWAMTMLGKRLLEGDGLPKNPAEGESWLRKAIELGDARAMAILGKRLLEGDGLPKNPTEGESWLRKAAELGDARAMAILGKRLLEGDGLPKNPAEGESWLRKAVEHGDTWAMTMLGKRLLEGDGLPKNPAEGESWLRKAAELGDARAMAMLGEQLLEGDGLPKNPTEGESWLRKAAARGDHVAMGHLGYILYVRAMQGRDRIVNLIEAQRLFRLSWMYANYSGVNLAYMLRRGETINLDLPIDQLLADHLKQGSAFALVNLALCHAKGFQRTLDLDEADALFARLGGTSDLSSVISWWQQLRDMGDPEGYLVLAWLARHGLLEASAEEVDSWWQTAIKAGWTSPDGLPHQG